MFELDHYSLEDLMALQKSIDAEVVKRKQDTIVRLRQEVRSKLAENGFTVEEVFGSVGSATTAARKRTASTVLYANPADPLQTWTGRGRKPQWLVDYLAVPGHELSSLLR